MNSVVVDCIVFGVESEVVGEFNAVEGAAVKGEVAKVVDGNIVVDGTVLVGRVNAVEGTTVEREFAAFVDGSIVVGGTAAVVV